MKKFLLAILLVIIISSTVQAGLLWTNVKTPVSATGSQKGVRVGVSQAKTFLWLFTVGDASIDSAARAASITKISHVDVRDKALLGIPGYCFWGTKITEVYGQ
jgi:TRL (tRNA-associated locus)-like protein